MSSYNVSVCHLPGSINDEKLQFRGLRDIHSLKFLFQLQPQFLHTISCIDCGITDENIKELLGGLNVSECHHIRNIDLSHNHIGPTGVKDMSLFLCERGLHYLNLSKNRLCGVWVFRGSTMGHWDSSGLCMLLRAILDVNNSSVCKKLEHLDISRNMLGQDDDLMSTLCNLIEANLDDLRVLSLTGNLFCVEDMSRLVESIMLNSAIDTYWPPKASPSNENHAIKINLVGCNLAPLDFMFLNPKVNACAPCAVSIDMSWNRELGIGDPSAPLDSYPFFSLQSLTLANISMDIEFAAALRSIMISSQCSLKSLDVAGNSETLQTDGFLHLVYGLSVNKSILYLNLESCVPKDYRRFDLIGCALESNSTLLELDLSRSYGCRFDAEPILQSLKLNSTLHTLRLSRCEMTSSSIAPLSGVIESNKTLTCLDLSHNYICKQRWDREFNMAPALSLTVVLRHLNTSVVPHSPLVTECSPVSYFLPQAILPQHTTAKLRELNLSNNTITESVTMGIAEALKNCCLLIDTLDISYCAIGRHAGRVFGDALAHATNLTTLLMRKNSLGVEGLQVKFVLTVLEMARMIHIII